MKKTTETIIRTEDIELNFFAVRSKDGKWLKKKRHNLYNGTIDTSGSWTTDITEAKVYTKIGPARSQITFWKTNYPQYGTPDLVHITTAKCNFIDETNRIEKSVYAAKAKRIKYSLNIALRNQSKDIEYIQTLKRELGELEKNYNQHKK